MTPDFMPPPAAVPMDPQALPPGLQTIPQVDGQGAQDAAALQNALKVEGATGEGTGTGFFDKLRTDPKLSQAMLVMGSALMQGPKPGQDQFGLFGNAMMAGALTHNMLTLNEGEDVRRNQESGARVAESEQRVKASEQKMGQEAALHPVMMDKYKQEVEQAKAAGDLSRVRILGEELRNGNYQKKFESEMANDAAGRASHYAAAGASNERRLASADERKYRAVLANKDSSQEERDAANLALYGSKSQTGQVKDQVEMLYQQLRKIDPNAPEATLRQQALDMHSSKKGDRLTHLQYLVDNAPTKEARAKAYAQYENEVYGLVGAGTPGGKPKAGAADDAWTKARNSVEPGQQYKGPDGVTYTRPK